nr:DUF4344 domain-containing metallopeptidase [Phaeobacter porticola]
MSTRLRQSLRPQEGSPSLLRRQTYLLSEYRDPACLQCQSPCHHLRNAGTDHLCVDIVKVESCGDANAFYDPEDVSITFCTEFIAHLEGLFDKTAAN